MYPFSQVLGVVPVKKLIVILGVLRSTLVRLTAMYTFMYVYQTISRCLYESPVNDGFHS